MVGEMTCALCGEGVIVGDGEVHDVDDPMSVWDDEDMVPDVVMCADCFMEWWDKINR